MPRVNLYVDDDQADGLRKLAATYRLSMSAVLRLVIDRLIREPHFFIPRVSSETRQSLEEHDSEQE